LGLGGTTNLQKSKRGSPRIGERQTLMGFLPNVPVCNKILTHPLGLVPINNASTMKVSGNSFKQSPNNPKVLMNFKASKPIPNMVNPNPIRKGPKFKAK